MSIKGFKAFDKGMTCKGFKYEVGKTYKTDNAKCCETGFHFCENPLDILNYYDLCECEFAEVEALGKIDGYDSDTKKSTTEIKIGSKLDLKAFINASFSFLWEVCKVDKDKNVQAASGDYAHLAASGDYAKLELNGQYSVGAGIGYKNIIKGKKGDWITLAEWVRDEKLGKWIPVCVKSIQIDGKRLKEDVFYKLENKKFVSIRLC